MIDRLAFTNRRRSKRTSKNRSRAWSSLRDHFFVFHDVLVVVAYSIIIIGIIDDHVPRGVHTQTRHTGSDKRGRHVNARAFCSFAQNRAPNAKRRVGRILEKWIVFVFSRIITHRRRITAYGTLWVRITKLVQYRRFPSLDLKPRNLFS